MQIETLKKLDKLAYPNLLKFIYNLQRNNKLNRCIPLTYIDVNAWEDNLKPAVYIHNKRNMFKTRRYIRFSNVDLINAIRFYNS